MKLLVNPLFVGFGIKVSKNWEVGLIRSGIRFPVNAVRVLLHVGVHVAGFTDSGS